MLFLQAFQFVGLPLLPMVPIFILFSMLSSSLELPSYCVYLWLSTAFEHYTSFHNTMWSYCFVSPDFGNLFSTLNPDQSILWCCQQHKNPCLWCLIQLPPDKLSVPWYNPQQYHSNMIDHVSLHNATGCRCKYKLTSLWKCTRVFPLVSYWSFIGPSTSISMLIACMQM